MIRISITDYNGKSREETLKTLLDARYVICYSAEKANNTIFCKSKEELFSNLEKDHEDIKIILELYGGSVDNDSISFLTKDFKEDN